MKRRTMFILILLIAGSWLAWISSRRNPDKPIAALPPAASNQPDLAKIQSSTAAESLLEGYGDSTAPPIEDLRKLHRVMTGYFTMVKEPTRNPIGGNEDMAAALRGENPNRESFVRRGHTLFNEAGLIQDRWGSPMIVHPEGWRQIEFRSAGPDRIPYTDDDLVITPSGMQPGEK